MSIKSFKDCEGCLLHFAAFYGEERIRTGPPSTRVAEMSLMQHENSLKLSEHFLETSLKHLWNTLETPWKLPKENFLESPLKHS